MKEVKRERKKQQNWKRWGQNKREGENGDFVRGRDIIGDSWKRTEKEIVCMLLENDQTMLYLHDLYNDA